MVEEKIENLVADAISELGYDDCFLVEMKVNNVKVEIYLDSDSTVTFEKCRKISRKVEEVLDEEQWLGEKYTLEVSSAGVGRPLKFFRQYLKNIGRLIEVKTIEGEKVTGTLSDAKDEKVFVSFKETVKEGKKKKKVDVTKEIDFSDIKESKIKVSF